MIDVHVHLLPENLAEITLRRKMHVLRNLGQAQL